MTDTLPTAADCEYASKVLKEEAEFCTEQSDIEGAAMLTRVITVLDDIQEPLQAFSESMARGENPMTFLIQWAMTHQGQENS